MIANANTPLEPDQKVIASSDWADVLCMAGMLLLAIAEAIFVVSLFSGTVRQHFCTDFLLAVLGIGLFTRGLEKTPCSD